VNNSEIHYVNAAEDKTRLKAIIENAIDGIITIDARGLIETVNPAAARIFGYQPEEVIGKNIKMLMPEPDKSRHDQYLENYHTTGIKKIIGIGREVKGLKKDGTTFPFLLSISEVQLDQKMIYTGIVHDISQLKQTQVALRESEHKFNSIINAAIDAIITINERGIIEMVNPAACRLFGYQEEEMIGQNVKILMPEPDKGRHDGYMDNYNRTGERKIIGIGREVTAQRKDQSSFPIYLSISEVILEGRKVFTAFVYDITAQKVAEEKLKTYAEENAKNLKKIQQLNAGLETSVEQRTKELAEAIHKLENEINERKEIEKALRDSENLYSTIAQNFPKGFISVIDKDLKFVFVEGKELEDLKIAPSDLIGKRFCDLLPPSKAADFEAGLLNALKGEVVTQEIRIKENEYSVNAVPLTYNEGQANQVLIVVKNIMAQKQAETEILNALNKERELNELKSRFVTMASHEFRTPLSTILSSASLISKYSNEDDDEKRQKHVARIKSSVNNLIGILNDFLSLSKLEEGDSKAKPEYFELSGFIRGIVDEIEEVRKDKQEICIEEEHTQNNVFLDKQILKNIIINLLSNAIKYSDEGKKIILRTENKRGELVLSVKDQGIGIPEADQQYLFTRFFRAKNAVNAQGTGLGLNIVKKYVDIMGGSISFESELNVGTIFTVKLPL
jgi:PAS domain S-box-containing protein